MKHSARAILVCILLCLTASPCSWADVTLNGYTFSDDSTDLWLCPYYNYAYDRIVDQGLTLYGYGGFAGVDMSQNFQQTFPVAGINCDVILERGYIPTWSDATQDFEMEYYDAYLSYAKDTEDNIHVLSMTYYMPDSSIVSWDCTDLTEAGTTLLYPSSPYAGQEVCFGYVEETGVSVGDFDNCVTITFDALPQFPDRTVTAYLRPGAGVIALAYNWEDNYNGFSSSGTAPEFEEESQSAWEEWTDKNCFISACSF